MRVLLTVSLLVALVGCSDTHWQQHQPTQSDAPFGGGFESSHRPGGGDDPMDQNLRRTELRPVWRGDNGVAETRVNTGGGGSGGGGGGSSSTTGGGGGPDARIDRRTQ